SLHAVDASRDTERARDRLEALLAREDLGDHLATLRIRQAQLGVDLDREERDALIDEALALDAAARAAGKGARLSAADRAWGEVYRTESIAEATAEAAEGLAADRVHRRLNDAYTVLLLCSGRIEEATVHARALRASFPELPAARYNDVVLTAIRGRAAEVRAALTDAEPAETRQIEFVLAVGELFRSLRADLTSERPSAWWAVSLGALLVQWRGAVHLDALPPAAVEVLTRFGRAAFAVLRESTRDAALEDLRRLSAET